MLKSDVAAGKRSLCLPSVRRHLLCFLELVLACVSLPARSVAQQGSPLCSVFSLFLLFTLSVAKISYYEGSIDMLLLFLGRTGCAILRHSSFT